jgi:hypothetical protein
VRGYERSEYRSIGALAVIDNLMSPQDEIALVHLLQQHPALVANSEQDISQVVCQIQMAAVPQFAGSMRDLIRGHVETHQ